MANKVVVTLQFDAAYGEPQEYEFSDAYEAEYGISVDPGNGMVWLLEHNEVQAVWPAQVFRGAYLVDEDEEYPGFYMKEEE